jgi:drug/metabolite transporter (DMT)-like permease
MNRGVIEGLGAAILFGVSTPLAKALLSSVEPLALAGLLYAGSGAGLLIVILLRSVVAPNSSMSWPRGGEWAWLGGIVFFGGIAAPVFLMFGLVTSAASTASLMLNLEAVFTALLAWFAFRENFDRRVIVGMAFIVVAGLVLSWDPHAGTPGSYGLGLIVAACLCWALDNNLTRKVAGSDALMLACVKGTVAGIVNLGLFIAMGGALPTAGVAAAAMGVGFVGYGVSLVLFVLALRHLGTARTGAYFSVAPFFGAILAVLVNGDPVSWQLIAAGALMASGVWLHLTERHLHYHLHEPLEHEHSHVHDEHHRHDHDPNMPATEPHTHVHQHRPVGHAHPHFPDIHHQHRH